MANPQHVEWLLEGVEAWNARQAEGGDLDRFKVDLKADLSDLDFGQLFANTGKSKLNERIPLAGYDFSNANIVDANLTGADLTNTRFVGVDLAGASLATADLSGAIFFFSKLIGADLSNTDLTGTQFIHVNLTDTNLIGANLTGVYLSETKIWDAVLFYGYSQTSVQYPLTLNHVQSIADLLTSTGEIKDSYKDSKDAPRFYFRGERQCGWQLQPSVMREPALAESESTMLTELISRRPEEFNGLVSGVSQLVTAQHHGLKTRFLDITSNPMVALFHACGETENLLDGRLHVFAAPRQIIKPFNSDTVSVIANYARLPIHHQMALTGKLFGKRGQILDYRIAMEQLFQLIQSEKPYFVSRIDPRDFYRVIIVEPQRSSERIRAQSGAFLVSAFHERFERDEILQRNKGTPVYAHYQLTIPGQCKANILDELRMLNITRETLFPGLDSSADAITEFYRQPSE